MVCLHIRMSSYHEPTYYMFFIDFAPAHAEVQPHWLAQPSPV